MKDVYCYNANVTSVYDGDSITCDIDCGFGIILQKQKIGLYGINAPEIRGDLRQSGLISRDKLKDKILNKKILLKTKKVKNGKYFAIIYLENENVNDWLLENKLAKKVD